MPGASPSVSTATFGGAVLAAIAASSCCIWPAVGALFGVSTLGAAATIEGARPLLLLGAGVLLFMGTTRLVGRNANANADACGCERTNARSGRTRSFFIALAIAAIVVAIAFGPEAL